MGHKRGAYRKGSQQWRGEVAKRLRAIMKEKQWSQEKLAEKLGVPSVHTVSDWINSRSEPRPCDLHELARVGYSIDWLLTGRGANGVQSDKPVKIGTWRFKPEIEDDLAATVSSRLREEGIDLDNSYVTPNPQGLLEAAVEMAVGEYRRLETFAEIESTLRHTMGSCFVLARTNATAEERRLRVKSTVQRLQDGREFLADLAQSHRPAIGMFNVFSPVTTPEPILGAAPRARRLTDR